MINRLAAADVLAKERWGMEHNGHMPIQCKTLFIYALIVI